MFIFFRNIFETFFSQILSTIRFIDDYALNDAKRTTNVQALRIALVMYRVEHSNYPNSLDLLVPDYLPDLPLDPETQERYLYQVSSGGLDFMITATLDDGSTYQVDSHYPN